MLEKLSVTTCKFFYSRIRQNAEKQETLGTSVCVFVCVFVSGLQSNGIGLKIKNTIFNIIKKF